MPFHLDALWSAPPPTSSRGLVFAHAGTAADAWPSPDAGVAVVGVAAKRRLADAFPDVPRPRVWTAFSATSSHTSFTEQVTDCAEGFRCVSRLKKFGGDHWGDVDNSKAGQLPGNADAFDYEFKCPSDMRWRDYRMSSGRAHGHCRTEDDCRCISVAAPDGETVVEDGVEKGIFNYEYQTGKPQKEDGYAKEKIVVHTHKMMTQIADEFDALKPHSDIGIWKGMPRVEWLKAYNKQAPLIQSNLDNLAKDIDKTKTEKLDAFQDQTEAAKEAPVGSMPVERPLCAKPNPDPMSLVQPFFKVTDVEDVVSKIRRFKILSEACQRLRDDAPGLAKNEEDEGFARQHQGQNLNCYYKEGGAKCFQLNCYDGPDDVKFRETFHKVADEMTACRKKIAKEMKTAADADAEEEEEPDEGTPESTAVVNPTPIPGQPAPLPGQPTPLPGQPTPTPGQLVPAPQTAPVTVGCIDSRFAALLPPAPSPAQVAQRRSQLSQRQHVGMDFL